MGMKCSECKEEAVDGKSMCRRHLLLARERSRRYKLRHRQQGLCTSCANPALPGSYLCSTHLEKLNILRAKHKNERLKNGRCYTCGRPLPTDREGLKTCSCIENYREGQWN